MKQLVAFLFFMWATAAGAGDCQLSGSVCVDTSPSKNISGVTVTLAEVGGAGSMRIHIRASNRMLSITASLSSMRNRNAGRLDLSAARWTHCSIVAV